MYRFLLLLLLSLPGLARGAFFADSFNYNQNPLVGSPTGSWASVSGYSAFIATVGNPLSTGGSTSAFAAFLTTTGYTCTPNQRALATVTEFSGIFQVWVRCDSTLQNGYYILTSNLPTFELHKVLAGVDTKLTTFGTAGPGPGNILTLQAVGTNPTVLTATLTGASGGPFTWNDSISPITSGQMAIVAQEPSFSFTNTFSHFVAQNVTGVWYVNPTATGAADGSTWADAWTNLNAMNGPLSAGDTVYISGGAHGSTQSYTVNSGDGSWTDLPGFVNGSPGLPVTFQIGSDSAHNGQAIFDFQGTGTGFSGAHDIVFSGNAFDGNYHFKVNNAGALVNVTLSNITINYVDASSLPVFCSGEFGPHSGIHFDHDYINGDATSSGAVVLGVGPVSAGSYGDNTITYDYITVGHQTGAPGLGCDALDVDGSWLTIAHDHILGYNEAGSGVNHQDGIQANGDDAHWLVYDTIFENLGNSATFILAVQGDGYNLTDIHLFNDIYYVSDTAINTAGSPEGFILAGLQGLGPTQASTFDNLTITNCGVIDMQGGPAFNMGFTNSFGLTVTNCVYANNYIVADDPAATYFEQLGTLPANIFANNVFIHTGSASSNFVSYTQYGGGAVDNLNLLSGAAVRAAGTFSNLQSTTDFNGTLWNNPPSVGPYEFGGVISLPLIVYDASGHLHLSP